MPLIQKKSKKAFEHNVETEMDAGKPKAQSLAIAYNTRRQSGQKMAKGGTVYSPSEFMANHFSDGGHVHTEECMDEGGMTKCGFGGEIEHSPRAEDDMEPGMPGSKPDDYRMPVDEYMSQNWAHGGMEEDEEDMDRPSSMADAIMRKRKAQHYASGGQVDIDDNGEEDGSTPYDDMNEMAAMKELYDDSQMSDEPMDSNEHGHDLPDEDSHDMISSIRKRMKSKRS